MQNIHIVILKFISMKKMILLFGVLLFISTNGIAQSQHVKIMVLDALNGQALPGATVQITGSDKIISTDADGVATQFSVDESLEIIVSYIGYQTQQLTIGAEHRYMLVKMQPDATLLKTVVVTATRTRRDMMDVPQRVSTVSSSKLNAIQAFSADDYLKTVAGINYSRGASIFGSSTVSLRGMGNEQGRTLVLLDGVPLNKSDGGSVNWNAIPQASIGQIEVVKGPGSSIHGGNAMGGVIHMISRTAVEKLEVNASQGYSTFNTWDSQLELQGRNQKFFWSVSGMYRNSDGYITQPADEIDEYSIPSFLDEYRASARAGYEIKAGQTIEASLAYYDGKRGTGSSFIGYGFENENLAAPEGAFNRYGSLNGRLVYRAALPNNGLLNMSLYGQREEYQNIRESLSKAKIIRYDVSSYRDDIGLTSTYTQQLGSMQQITAGVDFRNGAVDGADVYLTSTDEVINQGKINMLGAFVQDEISIPGTKFSILAGLRFDHASFYDGRFLVNNPTAETEFLQDYDGDLSDANFNALSPRIGIQYFTNSKYRLFAGYSRGFRSPVLDDMCRTGRISGGMKLANPNLKPEYLDNFEIGADIFPTEKIHLSASLYYAIGTNYHAYIATGDSLILNNRMRPIRIKDNIGEVAITGLELEAEWNILQNLSWNFAYTYTDTEIKDYKRFNDLIDDDLTGKMLVYQPKNSLFTSISWKSKIVNGFISWNYKGEQAINDINTEKIEAFNYVDFHLWRSIYKGLSASLEAHNLLDQDFIDSRNLVAPGRMVMVKLRYKL